MKTSILWTCALAVVLWTGAQAMGQGKGQGKGQEKGNAARVKENASASDAARQAPETVGKPDKGKDGKLAEGGSQEIGKPDGAKGKKAPESADSTVKGKGKGHQQQLQALDKQLRHAQAKQLERQARLARIRELAVQKGDTETVARVDKLIAKQNEVFNRKQQHLQGQKRAGQQQAEGQAAPATPSAEAPTQVQTPKPADANDATN